MLELKKNFFKNENEIREEITRVIAEDSQNIDKKAKLIKKLPFKAHF